MNGSTDGLNNISLRDWFAGQALIGLLADGEHRLFGPLAAEDSYEYADEMLRVREHGPRP